MLISVKLIMIQLELNDIGYKLVFHNYSKSTSNTWYTLICKFEKCKPNLKKLHGYERILFVGFLFQKEKLKKLKKRRERK
jgi:hypothetical protein